MEEPQQPEARHRREEEAPPQLPLRQQRDDVVHDLMETLMNYIPYDQLVTYTFQATALLVTFFPKVSYSVLFLYTLESILTKDPVAQPIIYTSREGATYVVTTGMKLLVALVYALKATGLT
jgi:hypothetical protein